MLNVNVAAFDLPSNLRLVVAGRWFLFFSQKNNVFYEKMDLMLYCFSFVLMKVWNTKFIYVSLQFTLFTSVTPLKERKVCFIEQWRQN